MIPGYRFHCLFVERLVVGWYEPLAVLDCDFLLSGAVFGVVGRHLHPLGSEPIDNFERDWQGNVKKHKNGRPVRKKGKRREAQPGDTLADGTVYQPEGQGQAQGVHDPTQAQPAQAPTAGRVHPELGRKLADVATKVAGRIGGEDWQFDQTERDILAEATSDATGGVRMPGWAVFVIVVGVVIAPRLVKTWAKAQRKQTENQRSKGKQANGRDNAPAERGPDHDGQNVNRQAVGFSYD